MKNTPFAVVTNKLQYNLQKWLFDLYCKKQIRDGFDFTIPPDERIAVTPPLSMQSTGNWGTAWHQTKVNAQWIADNAQRKVAVFVLDTGAGFSNDRLNAAWWQDEGRIFTGESRGVDTQSHSTHVSSSIGGVDPAKPIGVAEELVKKGLLKIIPYKVLNDSGSGYFNWITAGIDAAVNRSKELQAEGWFCIINMSLGGRGQNQSLDEACDRADAAGVLVFAASGNNNGPVGTPANGPGAMAIAAHDQGGKRASFSNYGEEVESAAAGVGILGLLPDNREALYSGTSMATPHAAGLAAIIASCYPWMDAKQVEAALFGYVHDILPEGWDQYTGHGSFKLSQLVADPPKENPDEPDEPDTPEEPEEPENPDPPTFTSDVRTMFGRANDPLLFRYRRQSSSEWHTMQVYDLVVDIVAKGTEEDAYQIAKDTVEDYFGFTAMVIPDSPEFGYETTAWWIGQFLEYQARQKGVALQAISLEGVDDDGRVALVSGFDRAGFRQTRGGAILLNLRE